MREKPHKKWYFPEMFHLREHLKLSTYLRSRDIWIDFKTRLTSLILDQEVPVFFEKAV